MEECFWKFDLSGYFEQNQLTDFLAERAIDYLKVLQVKPWGAPLHEFGANVWAREFD